MRAGCLAHVRRKFNDALKLDPQDREAAAVLLLMGKLYAVEKEAREAGATEEQRLALRQQRSVALFKELQAKITQIASHVLPSSKLAEACQYALNQWTRLKLYLENGRIEIDQNLCENAMRGLAVGRKNWLHIGSPEAGPKIAAILRSWRPASASRSTCANTSTTSCLSFPPGLLTTSPPSPR